MSDKFNLCCEVMKVHFEMQICVILFVEKKKFVGLITSAPLRLPSSNGIVALF